MSASATQGGHNKVLWSVKRAMENLHNKFGFCFFRPPCTVKVIQGLTGEWTLSCYAGSVTYRVAHWVPYVLLPLYTRPVGVALGISVIRVAYQFATSRVLNRRSTAWQPGKMDYSNLIDLLRTRRKFGAVFAALEFSMFWTWSYLSNLIVWVKRRTY